MRRHSHCIHAEVEDRLSYHSDAYLVVASLYIRSRELASYLRIEHEIAGPLI